MPFYDKDKKLQVLPLLAAKKVEITVAGRRVQLTAEEAETAAEEMQNAAKRIGGHSQSLDLSDLAENWSLDSEQRYGNSH